MLPDSQPPRGCYAGELGGVNQGAMRSHPPLDSDARVGQLCGLTVVLSQLAALSGELAGELATRQLASWLASSTPLAALMSSRTPNEHPTIIS